MAENNNTEDIVAQARADKLKAETAMIKAEARRISAEALKFKSERNKLDAEIARMEKDQEQDSEKASLLKLQQEQVNAETELAKDRARVLKEEESNKAANKKARKKRLKQFNDSVNQAPDIQQFVQETLQQIMAGVDAAAGKSKALDLAGPASEFLGSVSAIGGDKTHGSSTSHVKFDLEVVVSQSRGASGGLRVASNLQLGILDFSAGFEGSMSRAASRESTNRISFSVPIQYAQQNDPDDC